MRSVPHKIQYLNTWSLVDGHGLERFRSYSLAARNTLMGPGFEIKRLIPLRVCSLCFLHVVQDVNV